MARHKRGGGNSSSKPHQHRAKAGNGHRNRQNQVPGAQKGPHHVFSLQEEARNTERHHSFWSSDSKLRHKAINFVSAGTLHPEELIEPHEIEEGESDSERDDARKDALALPEVAMASMKIRTDDEDEASWSTSEFGKDGSKQDRSQQAEEPSPPPFFVDTIGSDTIATGLPAPVVRSHSPTPSDSSEEVIIFKGRGTTSKAPAASSQSSHLASSNVLASQTASFTVSASGEASTKISTFSTSKPDEPVGGSTNGGQSEASDEVLPDYVSKVSKGKSPWEFGSTPWVHRSKPGVGWDKPAMPPPTRRSKKPKNRRILNGPDDEAVADYIENLRRQEEEETDDPGFGNMLFGQRPLHFDDGNDLPEEFDPSSPQASPRRKQASADNEDTDYDGWDSTMLNDFEDVSTSSEFEGIVARILAKRERKNGLQYLIVYEGTVVDDARWLPECNLTTDQDRMLLRTFEDSLLEKTRVLFESDESDDEEEEEEEEEEAYRIFGDSDEDSSEDEEGDDDDSFLDEKDLIERKIERMTDEELARLLAKQEELGLGSDEPVLFDGNEDYDGIGNLDGGLSYVSGRRTSRRPGQWQKRAKGIYPSASLMADVLEQDPYGGFDIMDFERPSLKKKSKGRKATLDFDLSDKELEEELRSTWEADRRMKSQKKKEREELRKQGRLGKKNKFKPDLSVKYKSGMTFVEIKEEIRGFLASDHESHALPPMDKKERAFVHNLAQALNLKSKSVGSGTNRFPTLIKTSRTLEYDERHFARATERNDRRFGGIAKPTRTKAIVSYRDGDVVGGSAPEIGADNRGRAMLEKMGWSSGTALGASRQGILQPITHTVKTTKLGLR